MPILRNFLAQHWLRSSKIYFSKLSSHLNSELGNPKQPTISIYQLIEGEYQVRLFRGNERIISPTFPEFNLTAEQIFQAGGLPA